MENKKETKKQLKKFKKVFIGLGLLLIVLLSIVYKNGQQSGYSDGYLKALAAVSNGEVSIKDDCTYIIEEGILVEVTESEDENGNLIVTKTYLENHKRERILGFNK